MNSKLRILGGGMEVGRLAVFLESDSVGLLLDYGVTFTEDGKPELPEQVPPRSIDAIVLSHVHLDHSGGIPLYFISSKVPIYTTKATRDLMTPLFDDFLHISGYYLPYEHVEVRKMMNCINTINYGETVHIKDTSISFHNAGHIPGSMLAIVHTKTSSIMFTGDVNTVETRLMKPANIRGGEFKDVEYLILEATYGSYDHPPRSEVEQLFIKSVLEVLDDNGIVLVPAFSLNRSQEILCVLRSYGITDAYPVYYDGMVRIINEILLANKEFIKEPQVLVSALKRAKKVRNWRDRREIKGPAVIVASSGMLKGGPSNYYLKTIGRSEKNAIFLVSFQAPGTPGREILEKGFTDSLRWRVKARIEWFDFSSHSGRKELFYIVKSLPNLKKVIVVHSERETAFKFKEFVEDSLDVEVQVASNGDTIVLD